MGDRGDKSILRVVQLTSHSEGSRVQRKGVTEEAGLMSRSKVP